MFVNAAAWGLMLTGKLMETPKQSTLSSLLKGILARSSRGIIRKAVDTAMRMMGEQFVTGETIQEALNNAQRLESKGFRYSYDMLGEAALTAYDAERYYQDYINAIHAIGKASLEQDIYTGPGISIKLSALHPRYQRTQIERMHKELYPKIYELALLAQHYNIGFNIDAEESERLEISLELLERLCFEPKLAGFKGIGFVIQAYQKRCFYLIDYLIDLAERSQKRLMIRLVKGAYWDSEIKKAQIEGVNDYPVFTRKVHTDLSYIACAKKLLTVPELIYPQFATHNAQSLATIYHLAQPEKYYIGQYEFQCLHGMGEPLYKQVVGSTQDQKLGIPCRIYAPVGNHETLLAYLVRRLLENGANTSFVNRIADKQLDLNSLIEDPQVTILKSQALEGSLGQKHAAIPLPAQLYGTTRLNSFGLDLANDAELAQLNQTVKTFKDTQWIAKPLGKNLTPHTSVESTQILNPAQHADCVGFVYEATKADVDEALATANNAQINWKNTNKSIRAEYLIQASNLMQDRLLEFMVLLNRESGKTYANAIAEVREAIDFLRYYAAQILDLENESSENIIPLGNILCISPWNFPLAIFTGQIAAALVTGNCVIAKPAEQTPLIASETVKLLWQAGIPKDVLQFLPGQGETIGAQLSQDARIDGIMFTGSTEVAKILQKTLASRLSKFGTPIPLIAETGGQNAMIVDSSALSEQVVLDVVSSAFDSAGQRCSALRVLCIQEDNAEYVIHMLKGAMRELTLGSPYFLQTDIGPVIDAEAQNNILRHIENMRQKQHRVHQFKFSIDTSPLSKGTFVTPTLIELPNLDDLKREIFGPVLHVITYKQNQLEALITQINAKGYGLTMGLHTRIDATIQTVINQAEVGNLYINRNIVGAVVGVQPFGGEGLSGTGPKPGGPLYIYRLMQSYAHKKIAQPFATGNPTNLIITENIYEQFKSWLQQTKPDFKIPKPITSCVGKIFELQGPTGELNQYSVIPHKRILSLAENEIDQIHHLLTIFSIGSKAVLILDSPFFEKYADKIPQNISQHIQIASSIESENFDVVLHQKDNINLIDLQQKIGPIIQIIHIDPEEKYDSIERLLIERAISINTTAAGGNASLMTMS